LAWTVRFLPDAQKALKGLDPEIQRRISTHLRSLAGLDNPRLRGKPLRGKLATYRRYRVGDYRIVCDIIDADLIVLVVDVGHRSTIYD
jgi:mRNA interferase RelE/StbE